MIQMAVAQAAVQLIVRTVLPHVGSAILAVVTKVVVEKALESTRKEPHHG